MSNRMEAFISHSRKDKELVNRIYKICSRARIRPNIAEFEEIEEGKLNAEDIASMISRSRFFVLFLTRHVIGSIHTQNWVAYEVGYAHGMKTTSLLSLDIYVFEPFDQLKFPIPYLDYYTLFNTDEEPHWEYIENLLSQETKYWSAIFPALWGIERLTQEGTLITCPGCNARYTLLSEVGNFLCPTCRRSKISINYI